MDYKTIKIESILELPFQLMDIENDAEHFIFEFLKFDEQQSDYSVQNGGVTGKFGIKYTSRGLNCDYACDITVGNVYNFYQILKECYNNLSGTAILQDYSRERTKLTIIFDNYGHCRIEGLIKNKYNSYKSGINFQIDCDQTFIKPAINSFDYFFNELARVQGFYEFLY